MEKLNKEDLIELIKLTDEKRDVIRKESYSRKLAQEEYDKLSFVRIKLNAQLMDLGELLQ